MSKPVLGYWKLRGLGQPIRMLLAYIGMDYEDKRYSTGEAWFGADKFNLNLDFPNVPYWIDGDIRLTEYRAILRHISRSKGQDKNLLPSDVNLQSKMDMLESALWDIWFLLIRSCVFWNDEVQANFEKTYPVKLEQISKYLGTKKFILGDKLTYLDFILYELIYHYTAFENDIFKSYPVIKTYKQNFEAVPEIAAYIKSPEYITSPCINPMAKRPF